MADDYEARIAALAPGVPVALLPVRLEARYFDGGQELRVRIYPDQIHVDAHEPEPTAAERDAAMAYWRARFAAPDAAARGPQAWKPAPRERKVTMALRAYAALTTSAAKGAVRVVPD